MSLPRQRITLTRYGAGSYVAGEWVEGAETEIEIRASIQPAKGRDLDRIPEGRTLAGVVKLITSSELQAGGENTNPDRFTWSGSEYEIMYVDHWKNGLITHYEALASLRKS